MSILYRAVWSDSLITSPPLLIESFKKCTAAWIQETPDPQPLLEGNSELPLSQGRLRQVAMRSPSSKAFEVIATDGIPGDATEWVTTIRVIAQDGSMHGLVELSMSSDDVTRRISIGRPRIVHELLGIGEVPHLGSTRILRETQAIPANGIGLLLDILADPNRSLPVIVCAAPNENDDGMWLRTADKIASRTEGVAIVLTLDHVATVAFKERLGHLAIWDGGVRVYAPAIVSIESEGWRHRYYLGSRLQAAQTSTIDRIVYSVAQLSSRRKIPDVFRIFGEQSGLPSDALEDMIPALELTHAREQWEFELEVSRDEQSSLERELASANGHMARLREELISQGLTDLLWGTKHESTASIPDEVQDTSEAVMAAQLYLTKWLALPDSAIQELEDIDTAPESYNWGNKTWRGLRAIASYAEDRAGGWDKGGFWEWCASGPPLGWPATSKKLSMSESNTVQNDRKHSRARIFKVDPALHVSGELTMLAHLKISEGGGSLAPRVYFYDDTGGPTKKVHVGLVGPHHLVSNKSTN